MGKGGFTFNVIYTKNKQINKEINIYKHILYAFYFTLFLGTYNYTSTPTKKPFHICHIMIRNFVNYLLCYNPFYFFLIITFVST